MWLLYMPGIRQFSTWTPHLADGILDWSQIPFHQISIQLVLVDWFPNKAHYDSDETVYVFNRYIPVSTWSTGEWTFGLPKRRLSVWLHHCWEISVGMFLNCLNGRITSCSDQLCCANLCEKHVELPIALFSTSVRSYYILKYIYLTS